jgi:UDP-glucuronate 4-epimerase
LSRKILLTGAAGFIGYHVTERLLAEGDEVIGVDSLNAYYDPALKHARLARLQGKPGFEFRKLDIADRTAMEELFREVRPKTVIHLAAQAGVRYSLTAPHAYVDANLVGTMNILEGCRHNGTEHLLYASSSSVYGLETYYPFDESFGVNHPVSLYAATKKANEMMAHSYSHIYRLPTTGMRFFTVYGPWGRPDMALFLFTKAMLAGEPIEVFNHGEMARDFTYVDDIVDGVVRISKKVPGPDPDWDSEDPDAGSSSAPYRVYNIGRGSPVKLTDFIRVLEECLGQSATKTLLPLQIGDVPRTWADISRLSRDTGYQPKVSVDEGVRRFVAWYREFYKV